MSNTDQTISYSSISENMPCCDKPSYVKKLNFNQSFLETNPLDRSDKHKNSSDIIKYNFINAPCTDKEKFVREWIIAHYDNQSDTSDDSNLSSPILGSTITKRFKKSPVLGNRGRHHKQRNIVVSKSREAVNTICASPNVEYQRVTIEENELADFLSSSSRAERNDVRRVHRERVEKTLFEYQTHIQDSSVCLQGTINSSSPILNRGSRLYKNKCKQHNKVQKLQKCDANANSTLPDDAVCLKYTNIINSNDQILPTQRFEFSNEKNYPANRSNGSVKKSETHSVPNSSIVDTERIEFELSNISNNSYTSSEYALTFSVMEHAELKLSDASNSICDNHKYNPETSSDSDKTKSDIIEDPETEDIISEVNLLGTMSQDIRMTSSESTRKNLIEDTEGIKQNSYSKMDQIISTDANTIIVTPKISQVLSRNGSTNNGSIQTGTIISTETTPPKCNMDPKVWVTLLNSGKKRKRPKKGSLVGRLQMLVNSQISFVRIWRHQMSQMSLNKPCDRFVTLKLIKFWNQYDRQLFEGVIVQDAFNLLGNSTLFESTESFSSDLSIKNGSNKVITIITNPEIVGKINVKYEDILKMYPPWDIIDHDKTILCALYLEIIETLDAVSNVVKEKTHATINEMIIQEFDCPCLKEERIVECCRAKFSSKKPNVIREIFNS